MELMYRAEAGAVPTTPIIDVYVDSVKIWGETFAGSPSVYVVHPQKQAYDETGTVITDAYFPMVLNERITARVVVSSGGASSRFNIYLIFDIEAELEMFA
jgi:hypothetical protein